MYPGILVQKITTKRPTDDMIEVAIVSMEQAILADGGTLPAGSAAFEREPLALCRRSGLRLMSDASLLTKLEAVAGQYDDLQAEAALPETSTDPAAIRRLGKELSRLEPVVSAYRELAVTTTELAGAREMRDSESDDEMRTMARDEVVRLEAREEALVAALKVLLLPRDPSDEKDVIVEIRQGAGGDEAALFARELLRMYLRYCRAPPVRGRDPGPERERHRRDQGGSRRHLGRRRLQPTEVRGRHAPRPAHPGDRVVGPDPHLDGDGRGPAQGRAD